MISESLTLYDLFDLITSEEDKKWAQVVRSIKGDKEEIRKKLF